MGLRVGGDLSVSFVYDNNVSLTFNRVEKQNGKRSSRVSIILPKQTNRRNVHHNTNNNIRRFFPGFCTARSTVTAERMVSRCCQQTFHAKTIETLVNRLERVESTAAFTNVAQQHVVLSIGVRRGSYISLRPTREESSSGPCAR